MKNKFADHKTSAMLREMGFDELCMGGYEDETLKASMIRTIKNSDYENREVLCAPLWQETKDWLWEKHEIWIYPIRWISEKGEFDYRLMEKKEWILTLKPFNSFDSPVIAEVEAIKRVVEYLHQQLKTK